MYSQYQRERERAERNHNKVSASPQLYRSCSDLVDIKSNTLNAEKPSIEKTTQIIKLDKQKNKQFK